MHKKFSEIDYKTGIYWIDFYKDLESFPKRLIKEKYSVVSFFKPYLSKKVFSEISFTDLKPTFKRFYDAVTIVLSKILNKYLNNRKVPQLWKILQKLFWIQIWMRNQNH